MLYPVNIIPKWGGIRLKVIISCSLNAESKSAQLATFAGNILPDSKLINIKEFKIPSFEEYSNGQYSHTDLKKLHDIISAASGIIFAFPIYNWGAPALVKYIVEIVGTPYHDIVDGNAFNEKIVSCICVGGVSKSFLSPLEFLNSLMVAFRCNIIPNYVFASHEDFLEDKKLTNIKSRIHLLTEKLAEEVQKKNTLPKVMLR